MQMASLSIKLSSKKYNIILKVPPNQEEAKFFQHECLTDISNEDLPSMYSGLIISPFDKEGIAEILSSIIKEEKNKGFPIVTIDKGYERSAEKKELKKLVGDDRYPPYVMIGSDDIKGKLIPNKIRMFN
jgi:hypothetical protein